ncbi:hypothetical protein FQN54_003733 [Arachnomyces sp. PD_36]|nr:hypothetical protein FQN54_003733 [Arachnomyces sp. PD_36]
MDDWFLRTIRVQLSAEKYFSFPRLSDTPTDPSTILMTRRLLAGQVKAGDRSNNLLVDAIIQGGKSSVGILKDVTANATFERYIDALVSASLSFLGIGDVLALLTGSRTSKRFANRKDASSSNCQLALATAASVGGIPELEFAINKGANVNGETTYFGMSLHTAASRGHLSAMSLLLSRGADPNLKDSMRNRTALHYAAEAGQSLAAALLLDVDVDADEIDFHGETPLFLATTSGHAGVTALLLEQESVDVNGRIGEYDTHLLTHATRRNYVDVVEELLKRPDLDVNISDPDFFETPLIIAADRGYDSIAKLLLGHPDVDVNMSGGDIGGPLATAAEAGETEIVKLLLACPRVDKNARSGAGLFTPFIRAACAGYADTVAVLLADKDIEVNLRTAEDPAGDGSSALGKAAWNGFTDVMEVLLADPRIEIDTREGLGATPLATAASDYVGYSEPVKMLLARGVDANKTDDGGRTPLHRAAHENNEEIVELLLHYPGIRVHCVDEHGRTPLWEAANGGNAEITLLLLRHQGTVAPIPHDYMIDVLIETAGFGYENVVEVFLDHYGSKAYEPNGEGRTALMSAAIGGQKAVVRTLLERSKAPGKPAREDLQSALDAAQEEFDGAEDEKLADKIAEVTEFLSARLDLGLEDGSETGG